MGIVSGFLGGTGKGMADAGKMMFMDKLAKERDEVGFMRDSEYKTGEREAGQEFKVGEREAGQEFKAEESKLERESRMALQKAKPGPKPQLIKYTLPDGREMEGILQKTAGGKFTIVRPDTGAIMEEEISKEELKNMAAQMNVAGDRGGDWIPFNEYMKSDPEVRAAVIAKKEGGKGIVGKAAGTKTAAAAAKPAGKRVGDSPHDEGQILTKKDGSKWIVKNGKPVPYKQ